MYIILLQRGVRVGFVHCGIVCIRFLPFVWL